MNASEWAVLLAGIAGIVWVNWYFFFAERGAAPPEAGGEGAREAAES